MNAPTIQFTDPVSRQVCVLEFEPRVGVRHPNCGQLADVTLELDSAYCSACRWNGRVSGAWVADCVARYRAWHRRAMARWN